jgi:hypothetical protein
LLSCPSQDYLKTVVPSQLLAERGANIVVINPGVFPPHQSLAPSYRCAFVFAVLF